MRKSQERIHSRYRGTLLGAAIADALAFPFQNYSRTFLQSVARPLVERFETHGGGHHPCGQYTDDTQGWLAVVDAILERSGLEADEESAELLADHLVPLWRDLKIVDADPETTAAMRQIVQGSKEWNDAALPAGNASCGAVTRGIPIGLWNCKSIEEIPAHTEALVGVTHTDRRVLAVTAGVASVVAYNTAHEETILGQLLDQVATACGAFDNGVADAVLDMPRVLSQTDSRALEILLTTCDDPSYPPRDDGLGEYAVPVLLVGLYDLLKSPGDWQGAVDRALRLGGNVATTASVVGAFSGSRVGLEGLPKALVETLLESVEIRRRADELYGLRRTLVQTSARGDNENGAEDDGAQEENRDRDA